MPEPQRDERAPVTVYRKSGCARCDGPVALIESFGRAVVKKDVRRLGRDELASLAALFADDEELLDNFVHERKRDLMRGRSRDEILDAMARDYTVVNRPVAVVGGGDRRIACGPTRSHAARYRALFESAD